MLYLLVRWARKRAALGIAAGKLAGCCRGRVDGRERIKEAR